MSYPFVAFIAKQPRSQTPEDWLHCQGVSDLPHEPAADVVVFDVAPEMFEQALLALRSNESYRFVPAYTLRPQADHPLCDGQLPALEAIGKACEAIAGRLAAFNLGRRPERLEERVVAWLWTRPNASLAPVRNTSVAQMYNYPLIEAFANDQPVRDMSWLRLMSEQGWFAPGELVDRIRQCAKCNSARLNYVDLCPECNALDIAREPALHCFTCGHVAAQENFLKDGIMMCPNCLTRLRHIGSDYDRPLENLSCRVCHSFFIDADVHARCLDCDHEQQPDALRVREVRHYHLTENARLRCRQGFSESGSNEFFGRLNLISQNAFQNLLDWQIQQSRRYRDTPPCSLLGLKFSNLEQLLSTPEGQASMDELIERIKDAIRDTDRCSRSSENMLWLLLPHTDRSGVDVLSRRLSDFTTLLATRDSSPDVQTSTLTLPDDLLPEEDSQLLIGRLMGELG